MAFWLNDPWMGMMGNLRHLVIQPLVMTDIDIENGRYKWVDLPKIRDGDFHGHVSLPEGNTLELQWPI